jgi:MFS transporter, FSR family, fosmidomycin resistance protein
MTTNNSRNKKILFSGCLFHIFHDSIADGLAVLLPFWKIAFQLSLAQVGLIITCFEGATALFQVPAGFLGERYGERRLLTLGTIVTTLSLMAIAFTGNAYILCALLIIGGLGAGVQHPLASSMISKACHSSNRRIALGTYNFTGDLGKFLFPAIAALVLSVAGWRVLCFGYGFFGLVVAAGIYLLLLGYHSGGIEIRAGEERVKISGWGIENKKAFFTLSAIGFIDSAVRTALITFLPFLLIGKGMPMESTGLALSLLFIGGALGKFICGIMAERIGIIFSIIITEAVTGLGILYLYSSTLSGIFPLLPLLGIALNGTSSVLYGTVADFVSPSHVPRVFGLFYTAIVIAAALAPPIFGLFSDAKGVGFTVAVVGFAALTTLPLAWMLSKEMDRRKV